MNIKEAEEIINNNCLILIKLLSTTDKDVLDVENQKKWNEARNLLGVDKTAEICKKYFKNYTFTGNSI